MRDGSLSNLGFTVPNGWKFLQENPNNTYTYQCRYCKCAFALAAIFDIVNYHYCPCCAVDMYKEVENDA